MESLLVLYDGHCALCNGFIKWVLRSEPKQALRFASLQSELAGSLRKTLHLPESCDSVIFVEHGKVYIYHEAVFRIASHCRYPLKAIRIFRFLPNAFSKWVYQLIARNRKKWFGAYEQCPLPPIQYRKQFIG